MEVVFLYCCPDCPTNATQKGRAIQAPTKKYSPPKWQEGFSLKGINGSLFILQTGQPGIGKQQLGSHDKSNAGKYLSEQGFAEYGTRKGFG